MNDVSGWLKALEVKPYQAAAVWIACGVLLLLRFATSVFDSPDFPEWATWIAILVGVVFFFIWLAATYRFLANRIGRYVTRKRREREILAELDTLSGIEKAALGIIDLIGAGAVIRTPDLLITNQLFQCFKPFHPCAGS